MASVYKEQMLINLSYIVTHKKYVLDAMNKMAEYFIEHGDVSFALELMKHSFFHDISKLDEEEFLGYAEAIEPGTNCFDFEIAKESIQSHYVKNPHHPEFWKNNNLKMENMPKVILIEMCCDWYAMNLQHKNSLMEWVEKAISERFDFPEPIKKQVLFYCSVLENNDF